MHFPWPNWTKHALEHLQVNFRRGNTEPHGIEYRASFQCDRRGTSGFDITTVLPASHHVTGMGGRGITSRRHRIYHARSCGSFGIRKERSASTTPHHNQSTDELSGWGKLELLTQISDYWQAGIFPEVEKISTVLTIPRQETTLHHLRRIPLTWNLRDPKERKAIGSIKFLLETRRKPHSVLTYFRTHLSSQESLAIIQKATKKTKTTVQFLVEIDIKKELDTISHKPVNEKALNRCVRGIHINVIHSLLNDVVYEIRVGDTKEILNLAKSALHWDPRAFWMWSWQRWICNSMYRGKVHHLCGFGITLDHWRSTCTATKN